MSPPPHPTAYTLTLLISGPGLSPTARSHWSFLLYAPSSHVGTILEVQVISLEGLIYQFEEKSGIPLHDPMAEGRVLLEFVGPEKVERVKGVIRDEKAPGDGKSRCQDWIVDCLVGLEAEELVQPGTAEWIGGLVGKSADEVREAVGERWMSATTAAAAAD